MEKIIDGIKQLVEKTHFLRNIKTALDHKDEYIFFNELIKDRTLIYTETTDYKFLKDKRFKSFNGKSIIAPINGGTITLHPYKYGFYVNDELEDFTFKFYKEQILKDLKDRNEKYSNYNFLIDDGMFDRAIRIFFKITIEYEIKYNDEYLLKLFNCDEKPSKKKNKNKNFIKNEIIEDDNSSNTTDETDNTDDTYNDTIDVIEPIVELVDTVVNTNDIVVNTNNTVVNTVDTVVNTNDNLNILFKFYINNYEKMVLTKLLNDCYLNNYNFKKMVLENDGILVLKSLHYDNEKLKLGNHFNIKFIKNNIYSETFHCYVFNDAIISITAIINLI
jgi:hypothetical protein